MARICGDLHFLNKNYNKSTTAQVNKWIQEMISLYGTMVDYFVYDYKLERHDYLLGEDRPAPFLPPVAMRAIVNINNDSLMLSKFGLQTQSDLVMYVDYASFANAIGNKLARPKAGDLIRLTEFGIDRPLGPYGYPYYGIQDEGDGDGDPNKCLTKDDCGFADAMDGLICCKDPNKNSDEGQKSYAEKMAELQAWNASGGAPFGPNIYEITTVKDEDVVGNLNPMLGHYAWKIEAIRFDNSYQPDAPVENGSNMVNDAPYYGKLPGGTNTAENPKLYPQTTDKEEDRYWDHNKYKFDTVYGGYGYKDKEMAGNKITYVPKDDPYSDKYWHVYSSLPMFDLAITPPGETRYYNVMVENEDILLKQSQDPLLNAKAKYYIKDTSKCVDPNRMHVYAMFVFEGGIALQYVGDVSSLDDVIYSSIFLKDYNSEGEETGKTARLWVNNGKLALTIPVTEDNPTGKTEEEENSSSNSGKTNKYTDTETKFSLENLDDPFAAWR